MITGEDEPSSGLNGRLRPRKSLLSPQTTKTLRKPESKPAQPRKTAPPSKVSPNKPDDLTDKSDSPAPQILCPYCDKTFALKQAVSNHIRRLHLLTTKQDNVINCLFCTQTETDADDIIRHMIDNHPNQYFACYDCHSRFPSTTELAEHKLNDCEKQKIPYRNKLRQKKNQKSLNIHGNDSIENDDNNCSGNGFNSIVISCELKPSRNNDTTDIEDNITTNLIVPSTKNLGNSNVIEKNAIIVLDDLQWNKRIPSSFSFHNTDADQILSRLGVVHRSPRAGDNNKKDWLKHSDDINQKFEKCFDTSFYSKVASNVQENLTKFLDGSFNSNPDPENTIKTRKSKNSVAINTVEGFPILLAAEQFSRNVFDRYIPRTIATKHKWKWDNIENDKNLMTPEQIKRDSHTNNCIVTLVSSLDIWTQLCMRRKFEEKFCKLTVEKRNEKQNIIGKELKEILESRELPSSSHVMKYTNTNLQARDNSDFPASLGLIPNVPNFSVKPAILSGEWVRPRCYVCCACGTQTSDSKALSLHISSQHPNAQIQNYEIVGEVLLNSDILKHLYVPPSQLNNRTRPLRGFRECTKCKKSITLEDLHQHMLDCAGDTPTVRRKCRYRPFGVRKRRPRLPDNTIRKEMRQDIRHTRHNRKTHMRPRPKIRTEVGDAETIRKMIADLPAKRHRVIANPLNPNLRPRRILRQRNKLVIKKRVEDIKKKSHSRDTSQEFNNYNYENPNKISPETEKLEGKLVQDTCQSIKQVSEISNTKNSLDNKNDNNKNRRKAKHPEKNVDSSDVPIQTQQSANNLQINQMSIQHNSDRVNINNGSFNTREHGNRNGSDRRDNESSDSSGQNNTSRDSFAPSQNVPLKHSIASLTASSETQDKSHQFHHLFLVQQECNNTSQHLPSRQREYFENEAIVTKLDKPPLHFDHQGLLDPQFFQRNKLNKPRKGLNDCIAMLKNKLVEPELNELPGHISVQCGSDEPIDPEPVIERRHSTTDSKIESAQRSLQMFYPNKTVEDLPQSYDMGSVVTGRPATRYGHTSRGESIINAQPNNDYMYWNQYLYEQQMYSARNNIYTCNRREAIRRRSVISTDELLLQHAMNYEILTNNNVNNFTDYQFPNVSTPNKSPRKSRQDSKTRTNTSCKVIKPKNNETSRTRQTKSSDFNESPPNGPYKLPETDCYSEKRVDCTPAEHFVSKKNVTSTPEKIDHNYISASRIEYKSDRDGNIEKSNVISRNIQQKGHHLMCHNKPIPLYTNNHDRVQNMPIPQYQNDCDRVLNKPFPQYSNIPDRVENKPMMKHSNGHDRVPANYNIQQDARLKSPLDLSKKASNVEALQKKLPKESYFIPNYASLELAKETCEENIEVVDLSVNFASQPPPPIHSPPEHKSSNDIKNNASDISCGPPKKLYRDPYLPTDLSIREKNILLSSCEKEQSLDNSTVIQNISRPKPAQHSQNICVICPNKDKVNCEESNNLANRMTESTTNILPARTLEPKIQTKFGMNDLDQNRCSDDEGFLTDLSGQRERLICSKYQLDDKRMSQYIDTMVSNNNDTGPIINNRDQRLTRTSVDCEQIINVPYTIPTLITRESENVLNPRNVTFSERALNDIHIQSSINVLSDSPDTFNLPIAVNCSTVHLNGTCNDSTYVMTEMPMMPPSEMNRENEIRNMLRRESESRDIEYEKTSHSLTHFEETHTVSTSPIYAVARPAVRTVYQLDDPYFMHKSNNNQRRLSCENHILEMQMPIEQTPDQIYKIVKEKRSRDILENNYQPTDLDHDPEMARKIAMLPKELVEILGTMPIDHRNQLLEVLPQYVSTSSSPMLQSDNTGSCHRDSLSTKSSSSILSQAYSDYKKGTMSDDGRQLINSTSSYHISQVMETTPISITSSILMTPPTPQLSDRHSNQSHENEEMKSAEYRKTQDIMDEQASLKNTNSDKVPTVPQQTTMNEMNDHDCVIDLTTCDDVPSEITESVFHLDLLTQSATNTSNEISNSIATSQTNLVKANSDKTASLRAVRIKTSSDRQRSIITENALMKMQIEDAKNFEEEIKMKSELPSPRAIQQAEVSSTQHRSAIRKSTKLQFETESCLDGAATKNNMQQLTETHIVSKLDQDSSHSSLDKQNIVTSSITKDAKCNITNDTGHAFSNDSSVISIPFSDINVTSTKKTDINTDLQPKDPEDLLKNTIAAENKPDSKPATEDDDSEDDVTLAVIVKQKHQESHSEEMTSEIQQNSSSSKVMVSDKILPEEKIKEQQQSIKTTTSVIVKSNESTSSRKSMYRDTNSDYSESQIKEKPAPLKKKSKKGRRVHTLSSAKQAEQQNHSLISNEANNEKSLSQLVSSEIIKNVKTIDDSIKTKPCGSEMNRLSNNVVVPKDTTKLILNDDGHSFSDVNMSARNSREFVGNESADNSKENLELNKLTTSSTSSTNKNNYNEAIKDVKSIEKTLVPNIDSMLNEDDNIKEITEITVPNTTPVRRSRRGKSLFDDNNFTIQDKTARVPNSVQHKAPLTKKHLIFSKLLLDEENHNKPILTSTLDKQENLSDIQTMNQSDIQTNNQSDIQSNNQVEDNIEQEEDNVGVSKVKHVDEKNAQINDKKDIVEIESSNEHITDEKNMNKRKNSPQSKRKIKKKKSLVNIPPNNENEKSSKEENGVDDEAKVGIVYKKLESLDSSSDIKASTVHAPSNIEHNSSNNKNVTASTDIIKNIESANNIKRLPSIEKRKSTSPDTIDLQSISKPKKSKSNDEKHILSRVHYKEDDNISAKDKNIIDSKDTGAEPTNSRNTTCYDKATKRALSKLVVVKPTEVELYDPYDIDLEDMVDKTEPYIRKENSSKLSFNTLKSTIDKTRKLNKSVSSDKEVPIDDLSSADKAESEKLLTEKTNPTAECTKNSGASDSDESTKSDVPLKKYVEEKEKKIAMLLDHHVENKEDIDKKEKIVKLKEKSKPCKKNKQIQSGNNNDTCVDNKTENEEELRSEQFMESFGFFSERKPRKSNLLATKKISETFSLIENDDAYYEAKDRDNKKSTDSNKKDEEIKTKSSSVSVKKATKRGRRKKKDVKIEPAFCNVCKRFFRRWDNYMRHQLSLYHISRLCEIELKIKTVLIEEEPNYLLAYRQQLNRLKVLQNKIAKRKKNCLSTSDIILPTLAEILAEVRKTILEQLSRRSLSRDEALFIDCCEMLKESHNSDATAAILRRFRHCNSFNCLLACQQELILLEKSISDDRCEINDDEMDSLAAKKIMESDEVRNLENDLISKLKEANGLKGDSVNSHLMLSNYEVTEESTATKCKKQIETKDKMYPDVVDTIDMFEDKFDKIKRKCRSQAAAAKQVQINIQPNASKNDTKKPDKKNVRRNLKRGQNSVPTKAALKGFEGIKVSIQTSDINMAAIVPLEKSHKKKKKSGSKKKRDRKLSEKSLNSDKSDHKTDSKPQKKVDVYEFMDTEDTEVFEFRPSTLMERLKSINNKELPSTSKSVKENNVAEISSNSGSDGDDFVYMSDDYVCSDNETENSTLSCELGNGRGLNDHKKISSPSKRKDTTEKNAVMGKIFKHNAVRSERKSPKIREFAKPKANLDQLFDSLLEDGPNTSFPTKETISLEKDEIPPPSRVYLSLSPQKDDYKFSRHETKSGKRLDQTLSINSETGLSQKYSTPSPTLHPSLSSFSTRRVSITPPRKSQLNISSVSSIEPNKRSDQDKKLYEPNNQIFNSRSPDDKQDQLTADASYEKPKEIEKFHKDKTDKKKRESLESYDITDDIDVITFEDAGVARQRARRKCAVGKQNVLAETWSSESEPDGLPPRPNSAESVVGVSGRKKKGRKKDGLTGGNRKANRLTSTKKHEYDSRVGSRSNRCVVSGVPPRPRPPYYWSDGDDEQEHPQQHGWIVGDSHKKLVTMLAHAKGRKRSGDDKRHLIE